MKKLFLLLAVIATLAMSASAQNRTFRGYVLSADDDEPLVGATVKAVGSTEGVMTNADGQFTITVPASVKQVAVTYVGMESQTATLANNMRIYLNNSTKVLDAVVVTGYGAGKKLGSVVGSVSVVNDKVISDTPAPNFVDALQGQVSGLAINVNSGDPSTDNISIILRGRNSLSQDCTPLFILDGAPISDSFFTSMNPADIESITVLKDAASTALYGSRGANGIIVITSKKGKYGAKSSVKIRANYGWSSLASDNVDMMNAKQYDQFRDMIGAPLSADVKSLINDYGVNTVWRDEMFKSTAPTYSVDATVNGGSESLSYYVGLGHFYQDGIIENSEMRRTTLNWSIDSKVNNWFRIGFNGNIGVRQNKVNTQEPGYSGELYLESPMLLSRMALPYDSPYALTFGPNGELVYGSRLEKLHYSGITMPWYIYSYQHYNRNRISGNMRLYEQINPIKGLVIRAQQAFEGYDNRVSRCYDPRKTFYTEMGDKIGSNNVGYINPGSNLESFARYYQFTYTNTAQYSTTIAEKHHASLMVGQESIIARSNSFGVSASGTTDIRLNFLSDNTTVLPSNLSSAKAEVVVNSYFLNGTYDFDNRYFFDFSVRRDGTSRLAPGHRWGTFGAFGVMWNMKNEKFLQEKTWLDDLRLHYSYGATGNSNVGNFAWMGTVAPGGLYAGESSIVIGNPSNNDLTWETIYSHDAGVNFRLFDRLSVTADYYYKKTMNMLYTIPYSLTVGAANGSGNVCSMSNKGWELEVQGDIFKNKDWYVGARVQFNYNKNQILSLWDGTDQYPIGSTGLIHKVGDVASQYYAVRYVGVDPADGKQMWLDKNDNVTKVFPSDAQVCTGKSQYAPWTGGFGANVRWKGFSASANFVFQSGKYMVNNDRYFICNPTSFGTTYNQSTRALNMWTTPGQVTDVPAFGETLTYAGEDTSWLEDASFTRLKNLTIAYDFSQKVCGKLGLTGLQLHFTGRNLWTISNFSGYDPEIGSNMVQFQYPNSRQYEFGVEVTF